MLLETKKSNRRGEEEYKKPVDKHSGKTQKD